MPDDSAQSGPHPEPDAAERAARDAEARAVAARARAEALRELAARVAGEQSQTVQPEDNPGTGRRSVRRPGGRTVVVAAAVLAICGLSALSGAMLWQQRGIDVRTQRAAEYQAIARQGVVNMMSLDFNDAEGSVGRVLDGSTGRFHAEYSEQAELLIKGLQRSKVVTEVTIGTTAVESMDADNAVVLVAARSQATNVTDGRQEPQTFRLAVSLARDGDRMKVSEVDFV